MSKASTNKQLGKQEKHVQDTDLSVCGAVKHATLLLNMAFLPQCLELLQLLLLFSRGFCCALCSPNLPPQSLLPLTKAVNLTRCGSSGAS